MSRPLSRADALETDRNDLYNVYWLDFTILGYKYGTSLIASISTLAPQLSSDPERRVGIILAPNCGEYGQEYTDSGIEKALNDVSRS